MSTNPNLPPVESLTGMDGLFAKTNMVLLILFGICCNGIALILGIIGLALCTDPRARQNALIVTILGAVFGGISTVLQLTGAFARLF